MWGFALAMRPHRATVDAASFAKAFQTGFEYARCVLGFNGRMKNEKWQCRHWQPNRPNHPCFSRAKGNVWTLILEDHRWTLLACCWCWRRKGSRRVSCFWCLLNLDIIRLFGYESSCHRNLRLCRKHRRESLAGARLEYRAFWHRQF